MKAVPIIAGFAAVAVITGGFIVLGSEVFFEDFPCELTPSNPTGPYYKSGAPFVSVLGEELPGERLHLAGRVKDQNCNPIEGATLDFWQTDSQGFYDNEGYMMRGRIKTEADGSYFLDTLIPGKYSEAGAMRPAHIHLKVSAPGERAMTTQLYFEGDEHRDFFVRDELELSVSEADGVKAAEFDIVIRVER